MNRKTLILSKLILQIHPQQIWAISRPNITILSTLTYAVQVKNHVFRATDGFMME